MADRPPARPPSIFPSTAPRVQIIFNNKVVSPGFRKNGIVVSRIGIKMYATIPALGVQVMFSGLIFSVEVPFSKFANNTEGQCGEATGLPGIVWHSRGQGVLGRGRGRHVLRVLVSLLSGCSAERRPHA